MKKKTEFFKIDFDKILEDYKNLNDFSVKNNMIQKTYYRKKNEDKFISKLNKDYPKLKELGYIANDVYNLKYDIYYIKKEDNE